MTMAVGDYPDIAEKLCATCRRLGERGWCRATSGNFSVRVATDKCMITQSGREKSRLEIDDLMICNFSGKAEDSAHRPSAETPLHTALYNLDEGIGAVLHTHSVTATVLSRAAGKSVQISGFEMQKAVAGVHSHEETIELPVFDNQQDMSILVAQIEDAWQNGNLAARGFLIRGHGMYAWGSDLAEAERHAEGIEFLLECLWAQTVAGLQ